MSSRTKLGDEFKREAVGLTRQQRAYVPRVASNPGLALTARTAALGRPATLSGIDPQPARS